jgi:hypothetical protein
VYDEMMILAEGMEEDEVPNKEIRYAIYCFVAKKRWGRLGRNVRQQIPLASCQRFNGRGTAYFGVRPVDDAAGSADSD